MTIDTLPEEVKSRFSKASMAVERKNYKYAIELLTQVINIKPDFAKGRQLLRLAEIKDFDKNASNIVIRVLKRIIALLSTFVVEVNQAKGDLDTAAALCEKILRNDPKNVMVLVKLGSLLKMEGLKKSSAVTLETAVSLSAKNRIAYELLGELYSDLGDYKRARYCFQKVLELKPHDANAERGLKNLDALTTIDKSFKGKEGEGFRIREIKE